MEQKLLKNFSFESFPHPFSRLVGVYNVETQWSSVNCNPLYCLQIEISDIVGLLTAQGMKAPCHLVKCTDTISENIAWGQKQPLSFGS